MDRRTVDAGFSEFAAASHSRLRSTAYLLCGDWERASDRLLRVSDDLSQWGSGGSIANPGQFLWQTPVNHRRGATQWVGELIR